MQIHPFFPNRLATVVAAFSLLFLASARSQADSKPNILFILVDDLKPLLGAYGDPVVQTPHMDRLASRGLIFDAAYCNQAICAPSRNALMTGVRPQTMGIYDLGTNFRAALPDAVTLPQAFHQAGYRSSALGKTYHLGHGNTGDAKSWNEPYWTPKPSPKVYARWDENNRKPSTERADVPDDFYLDGVMAREVVRRIEAWDPATNPPFFMAAGFIRPHLPFAAPEKYWALYDGKNLPIPSRLTPPEGAPGIAVNRGGEFRAYSDIPQDLNITPEQAQTLTHGYYAATSYVDAQIGLILDALDRKGLWENTIVVLWGDHGFHLGGLGCWGKYTCYEEAARIPFIVVTPDGVKGERTAALIETIDIYPTLADLAGLEAPEDIDGRSFASLLKKPDQQFRDWITHVILRPERNNMIGQAVRTPTHRYVEWKVPGSDDPQPERELYEVKVGGMETKNLVNELPETAQKLQALVDGLQAKPQLKSPKPANAEKPSAKKPEN